LAVAETEAPTTTPAELFAPWKIAVSPGLRPGFVALAFSGAPALGCPEAVRPGQRRLEKHEDEHRDTRVEVGGFNAMSTKVARASSPAGADSQERLRISTRSP
jgi:hypothetical protein